MRRPDSVPDPAFNSADLDKAVNEVVGRMGSQGDSQVQSYGPPRTALSEDHNSEGIWNDRIS